MKYIKKNPEPAAFAQWKQQSNADWKPNWDNFQKPEKPIVHDALLSEQGYICCYCGQRINQITSHIEHFQPRTFYPNLKLEYKNFLASCPGYPEEDEPKPTQTKPSQEFCGQHKGAWYDEKLTVSPLQPDCESYFRHTGTGEILSSSDKTKKEASDATIVHLNLNHRKLQAQRRSAIEGVLQDIETFTPDELKSLIDSYDRLDSSGQYTPFCAVIIYTLKQFIGS